MQDRFWQTVIFIVSWAIIGSSYSQNELFSEEKKNPLLNVDLITPNCKQEMRLPAPQETQTATKTLSIREAILLALRNNPIVKSSEIQRIVDKYQVILAQQKFRPQYSLNYSQTIGPSILSSYNVAPSVTMLTPWGARMGIGYANTFRGEDGGATVTWEQPLIRGFGAVNTVEYHNALANEQVAKLGFKKNIIDIVILVISAYRQLVQDYQSLAIQKRFLRESDLALKQYRLKVKVGKMAPSDILQQKANYEMTRLSLVQQENRVQQDYQALLSAIGLRPSATLIIQQKIKLDSFQLPTQEIAVQRALAGNIAYRQVLLQLQNIQRAIIVAKDAQKWQLNLTGSAVIGQPDSLQGVLVTPENSVSLTLNLDIPIDNVQAKAEEVQARIAYEQAKLALEQQREDLIRQVMTQLQTIKSDWQQIAVSRNTVALQAATLKAAKTRLSFGRATVFEVTQDQDLLLQQETNLVSTEVTYLNDMTQLHNIWGNELEVRHIQLIY